MISPPYSSGGGPSFIFFPWTTGVPKLGVSVGVSGVGELGERGEPGEQGEPGERRGGGRFRRRWGRGLSYVITKSQYWGMWGGEQAPGEGEGRG